LLLGVIGLAALQIRRNWQDKPKTTRQSKVEKVFYSPMFFTGLFRYWMRWSLERNPIGWLEKRSWLGRIAALIWLSVMISFASAVASYANAFRGDGVSLLNGLMRMLLVGWALTLLSRSVRPNLWRSCSDESLFYLWCCMTTTTRFRLCDISGSASA
jgi:hypothetical protein